MNVSYHQERMLHVHTFGQQETDTSFYFLAIQPVASIYQETTIKKNIVFIQHFTDVSTSCLFSPEGYMLQAQQVMAKEELQLYITCIQAKNLPAGEVLQHFRENSHQTNVTQSTYNLMEIINHSVPTINIQIRPIYRQTKKS